MQICDSIQKQEILKNVEMKKKQEKQKYLQHPIVRVHIDFKGYVEIKMRDIKNGTKYRPLGQRYGFNQ